MNSPKQARGFFVTGTDTGVGKTLVACAVLQAYAAQGLRVIGMKPVAAGAHFENGVWVNQDADDLIAASNVTAPRNTINPYCFEPPIAPHIAAALQDNEIETKFICENFQHLTTLADIVVVEGAGGFCVPLNALETSADLAQQLALPVLLVVGMRLGCINHALLSAEVIRSRRLHLAGWIANHIDAAMLHADDNIAALQARLDAPMISRVAYVDAPQSAVVAQGLDLSALT